MTRLLLPLLVLVTGCTESGDILDVNFDRLDVNSIDWEQVDTNFVFRIDNPNPLGITLSRFDYTLSFDGVDWLSGDQPDGLEVLAADSSEVALPALVGFQNLYDMVQATRGDDSIPFTLAGEFGFETPWGELDLPYDADGDFPALRTPKISYKKVQLADISLTGATIDVVLDVDNDLGSNIWFSNFDYLLKLEGESVASGLIDDLGEVDGASTGTLSIPVDISFADAGMGIYSALTSDTIKVGLEANTDVDTPFGPLPLSIDETGRVQIQ